MSSMERVHPELQVLYQEYPWILYQPNTETAYLPPNYYDRLLKPYTFNGKSDLEYFLESVNDRFKPPMDNVLEMVSGSGRATDALLKTGIGFRSLDLVDLSEEMENFIEAFATPYDLSGPCPTASLATLLQGLKINELRGEQYRTRLWELTNYTITKLRRLGFNVLNKTGFPIISVYIGDTEKLIKTANIFFDEGIMVTVAPFPMMKKGEEVHRITITAANINEEVEHLVKSFEKIKEYI